MLNVFGLKYVEAYKVEISPICIIKPFLFFPIWIVHIVFE